MRKLHRIARNVVIMLWLLSAMAQSVRAEQPLIPDSAVSYEPTGEQSGTSEPAEPFSPPTPPGFWKRANLLGDILGSETFLGKHGITIGLTETSEVLGNVTGGVKRGADYEGLTAMTLSLDTEKAFDWAGGTFYVSALQIHGRGLSRDNLHNLQVVSSIEADRGTRLWELWIQQSFWGGKADLKIGQQSLDQEFIVSRYGSVYVNAMMGWPILPTADLYAGGPAYPLSSLGIRFRLQPTGSLTVLGGVFNDNPPGGSFNDDSQVRDCEASGTRFNLNTGALLIGELQYAVHQAANENNKCNNLTCGLPGTYKLGAWYDTANFPDQRFGTDGLSLADPAGSGKARQHRGNFSGYAVFDQMLWREKGPCSVATFLRIMAAPVDRNLIDWSLNAGVNLKAPLPERDSDTLAIGYGLAHISGRASALDRDIAHFTDRSCPVRSAEHFIEMTYQCQITTWWIIQPDVHYIINPGGGLSNPYNPGKRIGDEFVFGLRTTITF